MGIQRVMTAQQLKKKWDNLKDKYRVGVLFFQDSQAADISCLVWTPETALFVGCTSDLVAVIIYTGRMKQKYLSIKTGSP